MNSKNYLARIDYQGTLLPTLENLRQLQKQHLLHIPFENWYIHHNIPITLDNNSLFRKIVEQKRGGFCYELNGLFFNLLQTLTFDVRLVSAQVYSVSTDSYGKKFDHMAIIAIIDEQSYLVDVGFGEFAFYPLKIVPNVVLHDQRGEFFIKKSQSYFIVCKKSEKDFQPVYRFTSIPRQLSDFKAMCHYHQTSPESHFTRKRLLSLATENGRITISGHQLFIREKNQLTEKTLPDDVNRVIKQYFSPFPTDKK